MQRALERSASVAWRLLVLAALVAGGIWLAGQLLVVVVPVGVAVLFARAVSPLDGRLRRRLRPGLAAFVSVATMLVSLALVLALTGAALADEADELGPTLEAGLDDVTDWLVDDSPFDVSRADIERVQTELGDSLTRLVRSSGGTIASGAILAAEMVAGALLAVVITFFVLKDGRGWLTRMVNRLPADRRDAGRRSVRRGWDAAGGYLRGAFVLGTIEAAALGITMAVVGAGLIPAVMVLTFLAAFVPIVGAIVAAVVAVLVALVTAGTVPALIVAAVALVVQQVDNDLLAPYVYGKALRLHPLVVLLGIAAGGSLFGFVGVIFAVPVLAVLLNVADEWRSEPPSLPGAGHPNPEPPRVRNTEDAGPTGKEPR
jgi:predicted PurR-regulated permease PerM